MSLKLASGEYLLEADDVIALREAVRPFDIAGIYRCVEIDIRQQRLGCPLVEPAVHQGAIVLAEGGDHFRQLADQEVVDILSWSCRFELGGHGCIQGCVTIVVADEPVIKGSGRPYLACQRGLGNGRWPEDLIRLQLADDPVGIDDARIEAVPQIAYLRGQGGPGVKMHLFVDTAIVPTRCVGRLHDLVAAGLLHHEIVGCGWSRSRRLMYTTPVAA